MMLFPTACLCNLKSKLIVHFLMCVLLSKIIGSVMYVGVDVTLNMRV